MYYEAPVTGVGPEFLAAQAATRQELKQTSPETPATTTQQFAEEVRVEELCNWIRKMQECRCHVTTPMLSFSLQLQLRQAEGPRA
jgi:hypothetical protein